LTPTIEAYIAFHEKDELGYNAWVCLGIKGLDGLQSLIELQAPSISILVCGYVC
jgi:hypothetical protein